ncbi:MAG: hypothetical protein HZC04_00150 [Candidatus Lloydbacteria bacterium]|nr:hypothetical protein [Candidatus Lloydbacteria bacterium]
MFEKIKKIYGNRSFPPRLFWFLFVIFIINAAGIVFHWYMKFFWFDMVTHTLGGLWTGSAVVWFLGFVDDKEKAVSAKEIFFISLAVVACIGLLWEIYEVAVDTLIKLFAYDAIDGLSDLFFDLLGASFAAGYALWLRATRLA